MRRFHFLLLALVLIHPAAAPARAAAPSAPGSDTMRVSLDSEADAFVVFPAGKGPVSAVIVAQAGWGSPPVRDIARRLARQGYVAIVPHLEPDETASHAVPRDPARSLPHLNATVDWLRSQPRTAKARIGAIGFGEGGSALEAFAVRSPELVAIVTFDAAPWGDLRRLDPIRTVVQSHFGAEDDRASRSLLEALRLAFAKAGTSAEIHVYPGAGRGFMHEGRDSYHPDAARQAWARTLAFLQKHLKA